MRGRIAVAPAFALRSRTHRETDRVCTLYTLDFGKVPARFIGVNRSVAKLRALSEPLVHGEYRLHVREGAEFATAAGGSLITAFPRLRSELRLLLAGLEVCELLDSLTPAWVPSPEKYALVHDCLHALESAAGTVPLPAVPGATCEAPLGPSGAAGTVPLPAVLGETPEGRMGSQRAAGTVPLPAVPGASWAVNAFALRLLKAAGFGVQDRKVSPPHRPLWDVLHTASFPDVLALPPDPLLHRRLELFIRRTVEGITQQPMRCAAARERLLQAKKRT